MVAGGQEDDYELGPGRLDEATGRFRKASGTRCANRTTKRRAESAYYRFPRPRAAAADNAEPDHAAGNRRAAHRGSRPDDACDRQAGVRRRGTNHEDARASAAAPRCPGAQAHASATVLASAGNAAHISGTKTTASSIDGASQINLEFGSAKHRRRLPPPWSVDIFTYRNYCAGADP